MIGLFENKPEIFKKFRNTGFQFACLYNKVRCPGFQQFHSKDRISKRGKIYHVYFRKRLLHPPEKIKTGIVADVVIGDNDIGNIMFFEPVQALLPVRKVLDLLKLVDIQVVLDEAIMYWIPVDNKNFVGLHNSLAGFSQSPNIQNKEAL